MADDKQKSALIRRHEQLLRWQNSETNNEAVDRPTQPVKVQFQDGCVFLAACSSGDTDEVQHLLEKGADINTANVDGLTALHQACIDDNYDMVEFLLEYGADVNVCDNEGWTPLHATASCGFVEIARLLLENGANVAACNNDGDLPFDLAEGDDMERLLEDEMDKNGIDAEAARQEEEQMMLADANQMLNNPRLAKVKVHAKTGATPLHVAAAKGYLRVMSILLQAGMDIDAKDHDGWTPLHAAAHWGQEESCKILVENMCDMEARNNSGQTVFDVADTDLLKLLEELKKKQATLKVDKKTLDKEIITTNKPMKRRTSVTRMSIDQKQHIISQNVNQERLQLEALLNQPTDDGKKSSSSSEESSEEEDEIESSDSETEKQNEINKQATAKAQDTVTTTTAAAETPTEPEPQISEPAPTPKIEEITTEFKLPLPPQIGDGPSVDSEKKEKEPEQNKKGEDGDKNEVFGTSEEKKPLTDEEKREAEDKASVQPATLHSNLERQSSAPARIAGQRQAPTFSPRPLQRMSDSDAGPASWRAGLRKTGSSSAVPESKKDAETDTLSKVQRSASSPWLASEKKEETTGRSRGTYAGSAAQDSLEQRQRGDRHRWAYGITYPYPTRSNYTANYLNSLQNSTGGLTQSAYVPYSRRRQMENERREREREQQQQQENGDATSVSYTITLPSPATATTGTTTTPVRRSYLPPARDEESETQRKARAKRSRETRRSTQGVTLEDLEEVLAKQKTQQGPAPAATAKDKEATKPSATEDSSSRGERRKALEEDESRSARRTRENRDTNTATAAPTASTYDSGYVPRSLRNSQFSDSTNSTTTSSLTDTTTGLNRTPSYRCRYNKSEEEDKKEEKKEDTKEKEKEKDKESKEDPRDKSSAIRARRKRTERRSTGIVYFNEEAEKNREKKTEETKEASDGTNGTDASSRYSTGSRYGAGSEGSDRYSSSGRTDRTDRTERTERERPASYSAYTRSSSSSLDSAKEYKKLYEEEKAENEKLRKEIQRLQQEMSESKLESEKLKQKNDTRVVDSSTSDKRERRALERKLSEYEEELKQMESIKAENAKLKEENKALTRVVARLSKH
ncbi:protein phosphatase 1 regulatory subunit 12A isoform X3 [Lingula anatina]|uniref:Protein phosphatase 1 regulatory subunit 12B n=1 Tax=Lingula anatina TaxID=7574 RepID=A0A1S3K463_LINAN|nr:protein phosphatase 1 regulatory subunit 12A isoform X3 [Lingula anatina]|eukprot:XP_013417046.1 protein phosphatase 1 regulatory subunit 12A isoform X3 [Lingula anatina]